LKANPFRRIGSLLKLDFGSLRFRLWIYFGLFAFVLLIMLWILQVIFLNYNYEDMKYGETTRIARQIENRFLSETMTAETRDYINRTCRENELYIQIETESGVKKFIPNTDTDTPSAPTTDASGNEIEELPTEELPRSFYPSVYRAEIDNIKAELLASGGASYSKQTIEPETEQKTLEYAAYLLTPEAGKSPEEVSGGDVNIAVPDVIPDTGETPAVAPPEKESAIAEDGAAAADALAGGGNESGEAAEEAAPDRLILFIFSPLYPMGSTIQILTGQLIYVTIIALLLSVLLGFYLSRMITHPLSQIAKRAEELAAGNFGINFEGAHYSEIIRLADTLSYTSAELAQTRTMQRDIIANVSHDLKTPLTMIRSYAEMINDLSGDDPEKRAAHLQVIMNETDRLNAMITELLDISKLQSGEKPLNLTNFSMKELTETTIASYSAFVEQDGYKLVFISMGEGVVRADETRIKQVLDNLISNALKYGGKDRTVELRMFEKNDFVRCEVTDHGIGISKRELKHIWERYYQSSAHYRRSDSTGLGLSIVKEILSLHHARFGVESMPRKGSTFWFEIPTSETYETLLETSNDLPEPITGDGLDG
jgi:signal transduction histidine kinase